MTIRVVVIDDNALLRAGLVTVLSSEEGVEVVAEAADGAAAAEVVAEHRPDVVLMDVEMPGVDGIVATQRINASHPDVRVLILTMFDLDEYVVAALRAGAAGFIVKTADPRSLIQAVVACAEGQLTVSPTVMRRLVDTYVSQPGAAGSAPSAPGLGDLTDRELDVLKSMSRGLSNSEIAAELYLAETTVKTHVARILTKLGVRDRLQAVVVAHRSGIAPTA